MSYEIPFYLCNLDFVADKHINKYLKEEWEEEHGICLETHRYYFTKETFTFNRPFRLVFKYKFVIEVLDLFECTGEEDDEDKFLVSLWLALDPDEVGSALRKNYPEYEECLNEVVMVSQGEGVLLEWEYVYDTSVEDYIEVSLMNCIDRLKDQEKLEQELDSMFNNNYFTGFDIIKRLMSEKEV